jgi:hypothetical protein
MDLKSKFYTIFKALNPYNYKELAENKFSQVLKYYFFIILLSVIIMSLLFIPFLYYTGSYVAESVSHFDNLTVNSDFKLKESFNILSNPVIRFETENKNMTNELVLITPEHVSYKHYLIFGAERDIPLIRGVDIANSARAKTLISLGVFFLLPSLFFWILVLSIVYFTIIILITYLFVLIITGLLRMSLSMFKLLKLCIYAATIFIVLQLLLMPFFRIFWLPLTAYWLLVVIILFLWRDESSREERNEERSNTFNHHGGKTKEIFGSKSESSSKIGRKTEVQDEYEVDEKGNLKGSGSSKKHRHSDEDDGYVEL